MSSMSGNNLKFSLLKESGSSFCRGSMAVMDQISKAADAICDGNLVEKHVRSLNDWSLLPTQVRG